MHVIHWRAAGIAALCGSAATLAHGLEYTIRPVFETTHAPGVSAPAINNGGTVMRDLLADGGVVEIITIAPDGLRSVIADTRGPLAQITGPVPNDFNDAGTVAFHASLDAGGTGVFAANSGVLFPIAVTGSGSPYASLDSHPVINNAGSVAFTARRADGSSGVFLHQGETTATLADTRSGAYIGFAPLGVALNDRGEVVFNATLAATGRSALVVWNGGVLTTVYEAGADVESIRNFPVINNRGDIVFEVNKVGGAREVLLASAGTVRPVVSSSSFLSGISLPSLNDAGTVKFISDVNGAGTGLFSQVPGEGLTRIIGSGDSFLGSVVRTGVLANSRVLFSSVHGMNDAGEIVFSVQLDDQRSFLAVATPVPEPSQWALLAAGLLGVVARRRLRRGAGAANARAA